MREPASIRYKNPGAMWGNKLAVKWGAARKAVGLNDGKGQGNNIAVFPTHVQGICAQLDLWRSSANFRNRRFADAIAVWSGHNEVPSYIAFCKKRVRGLNENTIMDDVFWQSQAGIAFLKAQAWHEAGKPYPASDEDWEEAQRRVFSDDQEFAPAPKPMSESKIGNGSLATGGGAVILAATKAKDVLDQANSVKDGVKSLGVFDMIGSVAMTPTFWIAIGMAALAGFIWYWRREHAQAGH